MDLFYLLMLALSSLLMITTANSVTVEANTEAVDNNTCWTKIQIPCETFFSFSFICHSGIM